MDSQIETVLNKLNKIKDEYWCVSNDTARLLNFLVNFTKSKNILEVGTSIGYSAIWLAQAAKQFDGKIITIESHDERFDMATQNFKEAGVDNMIIQIKGHAPEILDEMDIRKEAGVEEFDFIFLDATKIEYQSYIDHFLPMLKKGGLIVADNAISHEEYLKEYKEFIFNSPLLKSMLLSIGTGVFFSVKV
jgi:predicted O-methyltransferase YrrM